VPTLMTIPAEQIGLWIQTGALIVSAVGIVLTIRWTQAVAKRRATLDLVLSEQTDPEFLELRNNFVNLRDEGDLVAYAKTPKERAEPNAQIRSILNRYELVAIGIKQKTIDEKSYKDWCRTTLVKDWLECKPFVMEIRRQAKNPNFYCELEWLAKRWANNAEKQHI